MEYQIPASEIVVEEEIKKSRFITYLRHTEGLEQAKAFWQQMRELHPTARHHCWAAVAMQPTNSQALGFSDDGEPAGTAGKPMLNCLLGSGIGEISAVVVRYYGGILLGTGGLVRAYAGGVQQALKQLPTTLKIERKMYQLDCDYAQLNDVQHLLNDYNALIINQDFQQTIRIEFAITENQAIDFQQWLRLRSAGQLQIKEKN